MGRRPIPQNTTPSEPRIVLTVEIDDGSLKSQVTVPVSASSEEKNRAITKWLEVMQFGLKQHGSDVDIHLSLPRDQP